MKITERRQFFRLLGLLALVLVSALILTGCGQGTMLIGGLVLGGIIGGAAEHPVIGAIIGGIIVFIGLWIFNIITGSSSSSSSSSYGSSSGSSYTSSSWGERRQNNPHTCDTCGRYSATRGVCKKTGDSMSPTDSCSGWE